MTLKLYSEVESLYKKINSINPTIFKELKLLYGKDLDMIGHKTPDDFPYSLITNFQSVEKLMYLKSRFKEEMPTREEL